MFGTICAHFDVFLDPGAPSADPCGDPGPPKGKKYPKTISLAGPWDPIRIPLGVRFPSFSEKNMFLGSFLGDALSGRVFHCFLDSPGQP